MRFAGEREGIHDAVYPNPCRLMARGVRLAWTDGAWGRPTPGEEWGERPLYWGSCDPGGRRNPEGLSGVSRASGYDPARPILTDIASYDKTAPGSRQERSAD